jgi:hypothetical protein
MAQQENTYPTGGTSHREPGIVQLEVRSNAGLESTSIPFRAERHTRIGSTDFRRNTNNNRNRQRGGNTPQH